MLWQRPDFSQRGAVLILARFVVLLVGLYGATAFLVWAGPAGSGSHGVFLVVHGALMVSAVSLVAWIRIIKPRNAAMADFRHQQLEHSAHLEGEAAERDFDARFVRASELADSEADAYDVVHRALRQLVPERPAELLMADSSQASLRPVTIAGPDETGPGCPVPSPSKCPAVRGGRTVVYPDSDALDACPHLRGRTTGAGCSAACVPVNVLGRSIGVLHTVGEVGLPPEDHEVRGLETIARVAGARIAMVRVLSETETAAGTDPLTGLMNRRQLEDRTRLLIGGDVDFAIAMADLDHFKRLNDTHGHETGDRALRVFADICRQTLRPDDLVCRYGGEEFVVVFPRTTTADAAKALGRLRSALADRLDGGEVPTFTCSFGVAASSDGEAMDEMLLVADRALYRAKDAGRNGIVIAGSSVEPVDDFDDILG